MIPDITDNRMSGDAWHIIKGIPVAVLFGLLAQTLAVVWYFAGLSSAVALQGAELSKLAAKLDTLSAIVQQGTVPSALNERRISELERQVTALQLRVADDDKRMSVLERK